MYICICFFVYIHVIYTHLMLSNKLIINHDLKIPRILRFRVQGMLLRTNSNTTGRFHLN